MLCDNAHTFTINENLVVPNLTRDYVKFAENECTCKSLVKERQVNQKTERMNGKKRTQNAMRCDVICPNAFHRKIIWLGECVDELAPTVHT